MTDIETFDVFHILGNKNRVLILRELAKEDKMTFSDLSFNLRMNPKLVRDHTRILLGAGIITKTNPGYRLTHFGLRLIELFDVTWVKVTLLLVRKRDGSEERP